MKIFLRVLLVVLLVPSLSCSKTAAPNNSPPTIFEPPPVTVEPTTPPAAIKPPVSNTPAIVPSRVDASLPTVPEMMLIWATDELQYYGIDIDFGPPVLSTKEAIERGKEWFSSHADDSKGVDVDSIQAILVRFVADAKFPEFNRLSWFIVAPPIMGLQLQSPSQTVPTRDTPVIYFWTDDFTLLMDDETGVFWGGTPKMRVAHAAPRFTINEFEVVQKYADYYGWWAAWYRLKDFNGGLAPKAVIESMRF